MRRSAPCGRADQFFGRDYKAAATTQRQMAAMNEIMAITSYLLLLAVAAIPLALAGALIGRPLISDRFVARFFFPANAGK